ncbi:MAG: heme ABC exporter ATP-binding subunit CcmA [Candidatus Aldehydirespiratoraceae bacterium]
MSTIRLHAAVALIGRFPALAGIDLEVGAGEVVLVQGPNGAGKSTLLRLCAGLLRLESGTGEILGHDLGRDRPAIRRSVGLLGHDTALYDDLSVRENLDFWAAASRCDASAVAPALDRLGVATRLHEVSVGLLSAGQRRRVALAAVVVRRPQLWLLDEPHAGLDPSGRDLVDGLVADAARAGATVLLSSHEVDRTLDLASRRITVAGGTITGDIISGGIISGDIVPGDIVPGDAVPGDTVGGSSGDVG